MKSIIIKTLVYIFIITLIIPIATNVCLAEEMEYSLPQTATSNDDWAKVGTFAGGKLNIQSSERSISVYDGKVWSDNYTYSLKAYNGYNAPGNKVLIVFNYIDINNYYFVSFGGDADGTEVILNKRVDGKDESEPIARYAGQYPLKSSNVATISLNYNKGIITVKAQRDGEQTETVLFDAISDSTFQWGKIGVGVNICNGYFYDILVHGNGEDSMLKVLSSDMANNQTKVEPTPTIKLNFNLPLNVESANTTNVQILTGSSLSSIPTDAYQVSLENNNTTLVVSVVKPLNYKTTYKLQINNGLVSEKFKQGLASNYIVTFKIKPLAFDIELLKVSNSSGTDVTNNLLTLTKGSTVKFDISVKNNAANAMQNYFITAAIVNGNNKIIAKKTFSGIMELNELSSVRLSGNDIMSENADSTCSLEVFITDAFSFMKSIPEISPVTFDESTEFFNISTKISNENDTITISGMLPNKLAGRPINIAVVNPNKDINNAVIDNMVLQNQAHIVTTSGGAFTYTFDVNSNGITLGGDFSVIIGGDDFSSSKTKSVYYSTKDERKTSVEALNAADNTSIESLIVSNANALYLHFPPFDSLTDKSNLAKLVLTKLREQKFDENNAAAVQLAINQFSLLEAYNQGKSDVLISSEGKLLYNEMLGLFEMGTNEEPNIYDFYLDSLKPAGKAKVNSNLMGKNYKSIADFNKEFTKQVVVFGINYYNQDGYGHINNLIIKYGTDIGLNLASYNSAIADRKLAAKTVNTLEELQKFINELSKPETPHSQPGPSGGTTNSSKTEITGELPKTPVVELAEPDELKEITISDIDEAEWAKDAVISLINKNVIAEPINGKFRPNDNITRAEFVKMVVNALKLDISKVDAIFEDVPADDWSAPYISAAKRAGIVNGIDENCFGKDENITRQDTAVIIYRAFKLTNDSAENKIEFKDFDTISSYATNAVAALTNMSVLNGMQDGSFAPTLFCTRAQAAKIINGVLK